MTIQERVAILLDPPPEGAPFVVRMTWRKRISGLVLAEVAAWLRESASGPRYDACRECDGGQQWILDVADELDPPKPAVKEGKR